MSKNKFENVTKEQFESVLSFLEIIEKQIQTSGIASLTTSDIQKIKFSKQLIEYVKSLLVEQLLVDTLLGNTDQINEYIEKEQSVIRKRINTLMQEIKELDSRITILLGANREDKTKKLQDKITQKQKQIEDLEKQIQSLSSLTDNPQLFVEYMIKREKLSETMLRNIIKYVQTLSKYSDNSIYDSIYENKLFDIFINKEKIERPLIDLALSCLSKKGYYNDADPNLYETIIGIGEENTSLSRSIKETDKAVQLLKDFESHYNRLCTCIRNIEQNKSEMNIAMEDCSSDSLLKRAFSRKKHTSEIDKRQKANTSLLEEKERIINTLKRIYKSFERYPNIITPSIIQKLKEIAIESSKSSEGINLASIISPIEEKNNKDKSSRAKMIEKNKNSLPPEYRSIGIEGMLPFIKYIDNLNNQGNTKSIINIIMRLRLLQMIDDISKGKIELDAKRILSQSHIDFTVDLAQQEIDKRTGQFKESEKAKEAKILSKRGGIFK